MTVTRVLHITPSVRLLGARRSLLALVRELAGTKYEPLVLVPSRGGLTDELEKYHIRVRELRLPPWRKGSSWLSMPSQVASLRKLIQQEKIGLIHCNEIYPTPHSLAAASSGGLMSELASAVMMRRLIHPLNLPIVTHMRLSVTPRLIHNYMLEHTNRIIAVSHGAAADFDGYTWKERKVRVVYNGIDFTDFDRAAQRRETIRARLGYGPEHFVIGQIGLQMPRKRPRFLIDAAAELVKLAPETRLLFVGEASPGQESYVAELRKRVDELGLQNHVQWIPFQQQVADYFAALDLNVLLSNDEGFGRVVIEAASVNVPTIGSDVGGIPELIEDGITGHIIGAPKSTEEEFNRLTTAFAHLAYALIVEPERRQAMGRAANERARRLFNTTCHAQAVSHVFDEAMEEHRRNQPPW